MFSPEVITHEPEQVKIIGEKPEQALGSLILREEQILSEAEEAVEGAPKVAAFTERNQLAMTMFFDKNFGNDQMAYV